MWRWRLGRRVGFEMCTNGVGNMGFEFGFGLALRGRKGRKVRMARIGLKIRRAGDGGAGS